MVRTRRKPIPSATKRPFWVFISKKLAQFLEHFKTAKYGGLRVGSISHESSEKRYKAWRPPFKGGCFSHKENKGSAHLPFDMNPWEGVAHVMTGLVFSFLSIDLPQIAVSDRHISNTALTSEKRRERSKRH